MFIVARRLTIIMLVGAVFAITFSAAVRYGGPSGAQSHFGANFTCLKTDGINCSIIQ